jgi:hypothetical protein
VEATIRAEDNVQRTHDHSFLASELWEQRADSARQLLTHDAELAAIPIAAPPQGQAAVAGMTVADANKHPVFEHCHFAHELHQDDDSPSNISKRVKVNNDSNGVATGDDRAHSSHLLRAQPPLVQDNIPAR